MRIKGSGLSLMATFVISLFFLIGCETESSEWKELINNPKMVSEDDNQLLIIADDRSGSTRANRQFSAEEYEQMVSTFNKIASGTIAVRVIGNPVAENLEFHRFTTKAYYENINVKAFASQFQLTMTDEATVKSFAKEIDKLNDSIHNLNEEASHKFMSTINETILSYKPAGKDLTNINDALKHVQQITTEPKYDKVKRTNIVLFSDGIHDADRNKVSPVSFNKPTTLHLIGWKDKTVFKGDVEIINYESKEGFLESFANIIKTKTE